MGTELNSLDNVKPPLERTSALRRFLTEHLADNLAAFVKKAWKVLHPSRPLIWSWHYDYLCEVLTLVKRRQLRRVIINIPPRMSGYAKQNDSQCKGCGAVYLPHRLSPIRNRALGNRLKMTAPLV